MTVTCTNPDCTEQGIAKNGLPGAEWPPDLEVRCGVCGQVCEQQPAAP
jgi:hypothetical protein